jgi:hypothetical protein
MSRPQFRRSHEVAAYAYRASLLCPPCLIEAMIATRDASPAARDMLVEDVLDQCAAADPIDRTDETTFDSYEFPKVVHVDQLPAAVACDGCHEAC